MLATAMIAAALIELLWGVAAERKPLEDVARPLTFVTFAYPVEIDEKFVGKDQ